MHWGAGVARKRTKTWGDPVRWNKQADAFFAEHGRRQRVFCASLADVFDNEADPQWRADLWALIQATPNLDWLLLTKRIGNVRSMVPLEWLATSLRGPGGAVVHQYGWPENVWMGATICNQAEADRDILKLLAVPAAKRFLSMEPLLGPVDLHAAYLPCENADDIDWIIVGGESGANARPMHPDWARSLRDQCEAAGVTMLVMTLLTWTARTTNS